MNIARGKLLIDAIGIAFLTAGFTAILGWPSLIAGAGMGVLVYTQHRMREAEAVTDDEVMNAMSMAFAIADDGRPSHRLNLGTSDVRGILTELHCHGLTIVRSEIVQDYPAPGSIGHYHKVLESQINQT